MSNLSLEVDSRELRDLIRDIGHLPEQAERILIGTVWRALLRLQREILEQLPPEKDDTGTLRQSIRAREPRVEIGGRIIGEVGSAQPYAAAVEDGTRPHFPPVKELQGWVTRKLKVEPRKARSVAFLVARKISMVGTEGVHMFANSFEATEEEIERFFEEGFRQVRDVVGTVR